jgi:hypothetical protein
MRQDESSCRIASKRTILAQTAYRGIQSSLASHENRHITIHITSSTIFICFRVFVLEQGVCFIMALIIDTFPNCHQDKQYLEVAYTFRLSYVIYILGWLITCQS